MESNVANMIAPLAGMNLQSQNELAGSNSVTLMDTRGRQRSARERVMATRSLVAQKLHDGASLIPKQKMTDLIQLSDLGAYPDSPAGWDCRRSDFKKMLRDDQAELYQAIMKEMDKPMKQKLLETMPMYKPSRVFFRLDNISGDKPTNRQISLSLQAVQNEAAEEFEKLHMNAPEEFGSMLRQAASLWNNSPVNIQESQTTLEIRSMGREHRSNHAKCLLFRSMIPFVDTDDVYGFLFWASSDSRIIDNFIEELERQFIGTAIALLDENGDETERHIRFMPVEGKLSSAALLKVSTVFDEDFDVEMFNKFFEVPPTILHHSRSKIPAESGIGGADTYVLVAYGSNRICKFLLPRIPMTIRIVMESPQTSKALQWKHLL